MIDGRELYDWRVGEREEILLHAVYMTFRDFFKS
nr:hypothetical protein [Dickeya zeae]